MKSTRLLSCCLATLALLLSAVNYSHGQGTMTFNEPWVHAGHVPHQNYYEQGIWFRVEVPPSYLPYYFLRQTGSSHSDNATPFLAWVNDTGRPDYVAFSREDQSLFGILSVDLRNIGSSGQPVLDITFNGFKSDGSMITQTFSTPPFDIANFTTFHFDPNFASGLTRVEIPTQFWGMDNLVWVPEPGAYALLGLGLLMIALRRFKRSGQK